MTSLPHTTVPAIEPPPTASLRTRQAAEGDRDFVRSLFASALGPFYNGDHLAHADRILDAHLTSGRDPFGHFSHTQRTFVLCAGDGPDAERLGVLHVVVKRQGTVKISPLILVPQHRSRSGLGTVLLRMAERFAHEAGARQLYCTVAASNTAALGFFLRHGFTPAGRSTSQYKPGITELMLYRNLTLWPALADPVRIRLFTPQDKPGLRDLVLRTMPAAYRGVDAGWADALMAGHERRNRGDVNEKFKIIYVTVDGRGAVRGLAAAGPKKGEPVKVLPLCADQPAVLALLLERLPGLFADLGRKLYTHLPPDPNVTELMQRAGWVLEGLMPGAYHPDICTAQWALFPPSAQSCPGEAHD
ncbi:Acetyltransferase (GNAT) family protein [Streptomyces sp. 2231.1]|uniref:GNAT family N-acetyltransferase n=1 Tax=Streptomyces sp. 2231.1 TaxID=1855347 RepID=UPI000895CC74|nr:GNAT family N-acetyltransferase [Streptomyces sp. 2231.1]SEB98706.1 Acetyltransferase (GNAT) family protein [Streptomyces sp. 2231.1]